MYRNNYNRSSDSENPVVAKNQLKQTTNTGSSSETRNPAEKPSWKTTTTTEAPKPEEPAKL